MIGEKYEKNRQSDSFFYTTCSRPHVERLPRRVQGRGRGRISLLGGYGNCLLYGDGVVRKLIDKDKGCVWEVEGEVGGESPRNKQKSST